MAPEPQKLTFEEFRKGMQVFLDFPELEKTLQSEVEEEVKKILLNKTEGTNQSPSEIMINYLSAGKDLEERIKVIIGLSHGSLEKFKRIYKAAFPDLAWSKLQKNRNVLSVLADFLVDPEAPLVNLEGKEIYIPPFIRRNFLLPDNWVFMLQDREQLEKTVWNWNSTQSKYSVRSGVALEEAVNTLVKNCGQTSQKGSVAIVDDKEVDIAIPNTAQPKILIMSSYHLTTSSAQSSRANEQAQMYQDVQKYNKSRKQLNEPDVLFINVLDGGGWIARPNDLLRLWGSCDYCFAFASLNKLRDVLQYQMG